MNTLLKKYAYAPNQEEMAAAIAEIKADTAAIKTKEALKDCFSMMDLTTLKTDDTYSSVKKFVERVNEYTEAYPQYPLPASVCVYSNFAETVRKTRKTDELHVTVVSACFPSSQSFLPVKLQECEMAVEQGADEVDIVLALNSFLDGDLAAAAAEIKAVREVMDKVAAAQNREVHLKVILETGLLPSAEAIAAASFLSMEAGADFIKTSTGKVSVNATPESAYIMCECIRKYYEQTGKKIGFKPAGGISSADDALVYYGIVRRLLGEEWLNKDLLRFGVSRMANNILSELENTAISFF